MPSRPDVPNSSMEDVEGMLTDSPASWNASSGADTTSRTCQVVGVVWVWVVLKYLVWICFLKPTIPYSWGFGRDVLLVESLSYNPTCSTARAREREQRERHQQQHQMAQNTDSPTVTPDARRPPPIPHIPVPRWEQSGGRGRLDWALLCFTGRFFLATSVFAASVTNSNYPNPSLYPL